MDLQTSVFNPQADISGADNVLPLCELAWTLEEAGEFERAAEILHPFWKGLPHRPDTAGLTQEAKAELLLRTGILTGWIGSVKQIPGSQEIAKDLAGRNHYVLTRYEAKHRASWMDRVTSVKRERTLLLNHGEACQLISAVTATEKLGGDMAEVGVAYGASAKLIAEYSPTRTLHLFDTFEGLPAVSRRDNEKFAAGQFRSAVDDVRQYLVGKNVRFYKGLFPHTAEPVKDRVFSFVHLDADLYESTMAALRFFYPRLCSGAIERKRVDPTATALSIGSGFWAWSAIAAARRTCCSIWT